MTTPYFFSLIPNIFFLPFPPSSLSDECGDSIMAECICLKPKAYSYSTFSRYGCDEEEHLAETKKLKGISRCVVKNKISHSDYRQVIETTLPMRHEMRLIRSKNHLLYIQNLEKTSLSLWDDKRYWINRYYSRAYKSD